MYQIWDLRSNVVLKMLATRIRCITLAVPIAILALLPLIGAPRGWLLYAFASRAPQPSSVVERRSGTLATGQPVVAGKR